MGVTKACYIWSCVLGHDRYVFFLHVNYMGECNIRFVLEYDSNFSFKDFVQQA